MPAPMTEPPTRLLILLVDDEPVVRLTLARALTDRGYEVRTAADGQAAITILEGLGTLPAIVITDLHMPRMQPTNARSKSRCLTARALPLTPETRQGLDWSHGIHRASTLGPGAASARLEAPGPADALGAGAGASS
jgi:ActR/RegA family two-component response regulator